MKTALSIPDDLFEEVRKIAEEENVSRSSVFADAIRDYLERRKNRQLLVALNKIHSEPEAEEDKRIRKQARRHYAFKIVKGKW